jgi:hypothetical protein
VRELYVASELSSPQHIFWFDSPFAALWAMALLTAAHDSLWRGIVDAMGRNKRQRDVCRS